MPWFLSRIQFWRACCIKQHYFSVSASLWLTLGLFLFLITLTLSSSVGQAFCWMPLSVGLACGLQWLDMGSEFGGNRRGKLPFSLRCIRRLIISACLIIGVANLDQLVKVMFSRCIHSKLTNFLPLGTFKLKSLTNIEPFMFSVFFSWIHFGKFCFTKTLPIFMLLNLLLNLLVSNIYWFPH